MAFNSKRKLMPKQDCRVRKQKKLLCWLAILNARQLQKEPIRKRSRCSCISGELEFSGAGLDAPLGEAAIQAEFLAMENVSNSLEF